MTNENIDVQAVIEEPEVYIVGQCRAKDDQFMYIDTRIECMMAIENTLISKNGSEITDKIRYV